MVQHALDTKDKQARRDSILIAARGLFLGDSERLPSAAHIADAAGLSKGTLYLYFRTKEEIFMALLHEEWGGLLEQVHHAFRIDKRSTEHKIADFLKGYVEYVHTHPDLLRLDALGYSVLERNLGLDPLRTFKLEFAAALSRAGQAVEESLHLPEGQGVRLLMHTYALTRGLWQSLDYPETWREMMDDPALAPLRLSFRAELKDALAQYWRGIGHVV